MEPYSMKSNNYNGKKKKKTAESKAFDDDDDGVGELLKAAQDDILLKLSLNSHIARATSSSSPLDPDLDSRFQALKSQPSKSNLDVFPERIISEKKNPERGLHKFDESDDLLARFAALKGSSVPSSQSNEARQQLVNDDGGGEEEDDEVEKLIKWAIDAARLDPSPPSDPDKDDDDDDEYSDDSDDEGVDHRKVDAGTKSKRK